MKLELVGMKMDAGERRKESRKVVGVEGGVWVGIDRYDNDGVPSDAKYTVLPSCMCFLTIPRARRHTLEMRTSFTTGDDTILSYATLLRRTVLYAACAGESLAPKCRFHLSISDRRLNSTLSPH